MKQLEQLIATGEGYQLEFKENIDKSLAIILFSLKKRTLINDLLC